ncbi:E3 ubiquitin-protein ligase ZNRF1-like [Cynara cardunculus var. scolymus]|uniref:Zinc finger, RING/FYVE/PHD-type n=1 Tax=Cynara cardunculus var. scolymus TaxID=59895 RepID=A0A118JYL7_CYNCS|nr:E3 ubiquitin-protein ligase ZNRF1-like [Cynara cardunculus var. scolymus]KVH98814.1 Zinc finger, RING/FYVE/PHD-type [Cynara cardunculus var. scolymus]
MPPRTFQAVARSANDAIVPTHLLETLQPNTRLFFIKLTVFFRSSGATTRHTLEMSAPCQHVSELNRLVLADIIRFLDQVGSPREALSEVIFRVTICAGEMMADESNAGRRVLPLEVFLLFTCPAAELGPPTLVRVNVEERLANCSVCLEELEVGSEAGRLPCNHHFHVDCINRWVTYHRSCPNCRLELG